MEEADMVPDFRYIKRMYYDVEWLCLWNNHGNDEQWAVLSFLGPQYDNDPLSEISLIIPKIYIYLDTVCLSDNNK